MAAIAVYITCRDEKEGKDIALCLLEKKLIACANGQPHKSFYSWKGKAKEEHEYAILCKTRKELFSRLVHEVRGMHSYELPCIVCWDIDGDKDYLNWVETETA